MPTDTTPTMTLAELRKSRQWAALAPQQAILLETYLAAGLAQGDYDISAAVRVAYPRVRNAKVWRARLKSNPRIRAVLHLYFGDPDTKDPLDDLKSLIRRSKRRNANQDLLLGQWARAVAALEEIAAKGNTLNTDVPRS